MNKILSKKQIAPNVIEYVLKAPEIVKNAKPGQFVILRVDENSERVPFTLCDTDKVEGTLTLLVQTVGLSTMKLAALSEGGLVKDLVGPLGQATDLLEYKNVCMVGGGIGTAVVYPQAKFLKTIGKPADCIIGARNKELIMYGKQFKLAAKNLFLTTDDGSYVRKGFVTDVLKERIEAGSGYDCVFAVGPAPMMRAVCNLTRNYNIKTIISMNALMVDGTGMCGCCRVSVGGVTKYACVDGPEFDGHEVDWDEAITRLRVYKNIEEEHKCRIRG